MGRIRSMTGFGRAEGDAPGRRITVEVRSLNHRYLEVGLRAPRELLHLDPELRKAVKGTCSRGKVDVFVTIHESSATIAIDPERARQAADALAGLAEVVGDSVRLEHVLSIPEVFQRNETEHLEEVDEALMDIVRAALDRMVREREVEGSVLAQDLLDRIDSLEAIRDNISDLAHLVPEKALSQISDFLEKLDLRGQLDPQRLEAEVALLAQRADVTEELTRLAAHLASLRSTLNEGGAVGRRLDFVVQEVHREINTIGAKAGITEVSSLIVQFKTELEKLREQVQNIE